MDLYLTYLWFHDDVSIFGRELECLIVLGVKYAYLGIIEQMLLLFLPLGIVSFKWLSDRFTGRVVGYCV